MNTAAHLIIGLAAFGRKPDRHIAGAAFLGALVPDLSLYVLSSWSLHVRQIPPDIVFGQMYFSDAWQAIFAVDNSIPIWFALVGLAWMLRSAPAIAFGGAGLLHLLADFSLHHDDARRHFWPFSDWVFRSPVSYWDPAFHGNVVGPAEVVLSLVLAGVLMRHFQSFGGRALVVILFAAELLTAVYFGVFMGPMAH